MQDFEVRHEHIEAFFENTTEYQWTRLFGINGDGGLLAVANVPKKYRGVKITELPFAEDNPRALVLIRKYGMTSIKQVEDGVGLYLFGTPTAENPKGTGTGKTTASVAIIVAYLKERIVQEMKGERQIDNVPAYFMKMAKFQNVFNSQFRGSKDTSENNADQYHTLKHRMIDCDLLVLDDIGLRGITESLQNELYEIIDERDTNERTTIFTSNVPIAELSDILSEQLISRIEGMSVPIPFTGKDHRKKTL